jgi:hypothetical protein
VLTGWLERRGREAIAYLIEENRLLRRQLGSRRLRLSDEDRRRLAVPLWRWRHAVWDGELRKHLRRISDRLDAAVATEAIRQKLGPVPDENSIRTLN